MKQPGVIQNGVVVLDSPNAFQNGTPVVVEPVSLAKQPLGTRLKRFAGKVKDLTEDMAQNHDHYLHGRPKK